MARLYASTGNGKKVAPASLAVSIAPSAVVIVASASRQRPAWASLLSWAIPSVTFGFWARGTWLFGRLCLLAGGFCGFCGGRRCGGVSATVHTLSSRRDAGDMFQRSAAQRSGDRAALAPELAPLSQRGVALRRVPTFRSYLRAALWAKWITDAHAHGSGAGVCAALLEPGCLVC